MEAKIQTLIMQELDSHKAGMFQAKICSILADRLELELIEAGEEKAKPCPFGEHRSNLHSQLWLTVDNTIRLLVDRGELERRTIAHDDPKGWGLLPYFIVFKKEADHE